MPVYSWDTGLSYASRVTFESRMVCSFQTTEILLMTQLSMITIQTLYWRSQKSKLIQPHNVDNLWNNNFMVIISLQQCTMCTECDEDFVHTITCGKCAMLYH